MYELYIGNKNYSSWSLRAWVLMTTRGIPFEERLVRFDGASNWDRFRSFSPNGRVPCLRDGERTVWDSLAIAEYLAERHDGLWPADATARAWARSATAEMHSGFHNLRSALPMNLKARHKAFKIFSRARPDVERIRTIWTECLQAYGGPYLFGDISVADAMYAPVCTRFRTYAVQLDPLLAKYCDTIFDWPLMREWTEGALAEPDEIGELDVEF